MPFRPTQELRQDVHHVIYPLTAAIARIYGIRASDGAYPLGAFYMKLDDRVWQRADGIWYTPINSQKVSRRRISEDRIQQFVEGIIHGQEFHLADGTVVSWDRIPEPVAHSLPPVQEI